MDHGPRNKFGVTNGRGAWCPRHQISLGWVSTTKAKNSVAPATQDSISKFAKGLSPFSRSLDLLEWLLNYGHATASFSLEWCKDEIVPIRSPNSNASCVCNHIASFDHLLVVLLVALDGVKHRIHSALSLQRLFQISPCMTDSQTIIINRTHGEVAIFDRRKHGPKLGVKYRPGHDAFCNYQFVPISDAGTVKLI
jgi:hypothetical protein